MADSIEDYTRAIELRPRGDYYARAGLHVRSKDYEKAIGDYKKLLEIDPDPAMAYHKLAWIYCTAPQSFRNPNEAPSLAQQALELAPNDSECLRTLGVALYRVGRLEEAIAILQKAGEANDSGPTAYELIFLAMGHYQSGQAEKAKECYAKAITWWERRSELPPHVIEELRNLRAEADVVLAQSAK